MKHLAKFTVGVLLFRITLDLSYVLLISDRYRYAGFDLNIDIFRFLVSYAYLFFPLFFFRLSIKKPSDFYVILGFLLALVPLTSMYGMDSDLPELPTFFPFQPLA